MKSFLQETAEDIVRRFGTDLSDIELIFPNKRTDFHFKKFLANAINKTSWSPKTYTIQHYASKTTGIKLIDRITLLFKLYIVFRKVDVHFQYDFDAFSKLGEIILHDFNEIDSYLVDANQIFTNIKNIHEIDLKYGNLSEEQIRIIKQYWQNFSPEQKSKEKEQFITLWNILPEIYKQFRTKLLEQNLGYEGLIYRHLANQVNAGNSDESENFKVFVGFNALNKAQKQIFRYLKNKNKALFYWDNDTYYFKNNIQEAGDFLRANFEYLGEEKINIPSNFSSNGKNINVIAFPGKIIQTKAIPQIINSFCNNEGILQNPEKTVIVLPDENMLFPVLNSIPDIIPKLNVTMGYPLKNTPLYSLLSYFIRIQKNIQTKGSENPTVFYKDAYGIINHPEIRSRYTSEMEELNHEIIKKQLIYIDIKVLLSKNIKILEEIFTPVHPGKPEDFCSKILNVLFLLYTGSPTVRSKKPSLDDENIYHTYLEINRLKEIFLKESGNISIGIATTIQFVKHVLANISLPFESDSTDGLQIMGLIETRNLDFDNIIILNANEGILPDLSRPASLISESMRHAFSLPVLKYQDSIFAYFFYRLIQRSTNVFILYDNLGSYNRSSELSRFVYQLELESGFRINKPQFIQDIQLISNKNIQINKNIACYEKLHDFIIENNSSKKQLSASAIDSYIACPFQFYLKYIASIREPEVVEEEFSPVQIGILIHTAMESIYKKIITEKGRNIIEKSDFTRIYNQIDEQILSAYAQYRNLDLSKGIEPNGNLLIIKEVIKKYLNYILKYDENKTPFEIIQLEEKETYKSSINIVCEGLDRKIAIRGIIDRIDRIGQYIHVIDYKTGKAEKEFGTIQELFHPSNDKRKKAIFQVLFYALILNEMPDYRNSKTEPGIYDVKNMYKSDFEPFIYFKNKENKSIERLKTEELLPDFYKQLKTVIEEIFNPEIPFIQTQTEENCKYCSYKVICSKP